ncbi:hypothetical protein [Paraliomyxa miuraensis]|uniref:hypothetical protein n=1 Tax=Paraliomyxa miuraensis TaxID=376150 RepID=UPI0022579B24|nr:hypothetical protein [Paraliomyxa miuraensis]MCX4239676.1 hypothetical protein [Paraliomyxa miuraensis]
MTTSVDTTVGPPQTTSSSSTSVGLDDTGTSSSGAPSTDSTGSSSSSSSSDSGSTTDSGGTTDSGSESSGSESTGGGGFVCPPGGGGACIAPGECASNACYLVGPLGGVCSECDEDADCAMGCSPGNPVTGACALCCDGSLGCGCETGLACQAGLSCAPILQIPGILSTSACSECVDDAGCPAGLLCSPTYDLDGLSGHFACVLPGSKAIDEGCDLTGSGDAQCATGQCAPAAIMGIPVIGVCSECNEGTDCASGSCMLPEVVINGTMLEVATGMCV